MTPMVLTEILKEIEKSGIKFLNTKTGNYNAPSTICSKVPERYFVSEEIETLQDLSTYRYFETDHWKVLVENKLNTQPACEGCGNKANKIYKKNWLDKGQETLDDVYSICGKCRVIDGLIISHKNISTTSVDNIKEIKRRNVTLQDLINIEEVKKNIVILEDLEEPLKSIYKIHKSSFDYKEEIDQINLDEDEKTYLKKIIKQYQADVI